jgi:hypothetical protein
MVGISQMNKGYTTASSFIYNNQLFVVGGLRTKTIETLDLNELPLKWIEFCDKFSYESLKPVFHSRISPPLAKNFDKEIISLHSFAAEEICSPATVA